MKTVGSFIGDWWRLVVPYFTSEDWPYAIPLLIGAIALTFTGVARSPSAEREAAMAGNPHQWV